MRYIILILIVQFFGMSLAKGIDGNDKYIFSEASTSSSIINSLDTVVFDLSMAVISSNTLTVPVYILSDDTVNALDFSLKYDHNNLIYDSVENLSSYIQAFSYYNQIDSTVRFTSNSLQQYGNNIVLVNIVFTTYAGQINSTDLHTIEAYLNGDPCSIKLIDPIQTEIRECDELRFNIYPNPSRDVIRVDVPQNYSIEVYDFDGRKVRVAIEELSYNVKEIRGLNFGDYLLKVSNSKYCSTKKFTIQK